MPGAASRFPRTYVLFALPEEAAPFLRRLAGMTALMQTCEVRVSGIGGANAARAMEQIVAEGAVRRVLICGFGGGLTGPVTAGTLIVADAVLDGAGDPPGQVFTPDPSLRGRTNSPGGRLVTVNRVLTTAAEKASLHRATQAIMADMETVGAVRVAERARAPWLAVRVATDSVDSDLPFDFNALSAADGSVDRRRVAAAAIRQPRKIPGLIRLGRHSALAAKRLSAFLETYLPQLPD